MISVCMLSKNSARTIANALESVRDFPEVLILDNGSTDDTIEIAKSYPNVKVIQAPFTGFGPLRNQLAAQATHDWILALDTDEALSPSLLAEINKLSLDPITVYSMPRDNYYDGKHIKGCGWHPDRVLRLYNRKETSYCNSAVHESVLAKRETRLKNAILHTPFRTTAEFIAKMQQYTTLYAEQHQDKSASFSKALTHALFAFFRSYFLRRGLFLGSQGFIISLYNANSVFYKYLKLSELAKK